MLRGTLTYTGSLGAGEAVTSLVFSDVTDLDFDLAEEVLTVTYGTPSKKQSLSLHATSSVAFTISAGVSMAVVAA